jgi:iron complex outermembrane receptor protein
MRKKLSVMISIAMIPLASLPVLAQTSGSGLEEITVTAQRREQNLQEVPISVTAFSGEALARSNIRSASEYLGLAPNVSYTEDGQTGARGIGISVRGVGTMVSGENAFINTVGVYIDEFSVVSVPNQVANPELPDMERIEILRGPQGTYFGRNAVGGALNLVTRRPTDEFEGEVRSGYETYSGDNTGWNLGGTINVPLSDAFRVRAVARYEDSDGYVENICRRGASAASCPGAAENNVRPSGADGSGHETSFLRLSADWDISERTQLRTTFFRTDEDQDTDENVPSGVLDLDSTDTFGIGRAEDPGTGFWDDNQDELSHDLQEETNNKSTIGIVNLTHQFSDAMTLKWVSGVIDANLDRFFDNDLVGGMDALARTNSYDGKSWSTELRLEITQEQYDLVIGGLYAEDEQNQNNNVAVSSNPTATINGVGVLPPFPEGLGLARNQKSFEVESQAVFADLTWHLDRLDLGIGARYTQDNVQNTLQAYGIGPTCGPPGSPGCSFPEFFGGFVNSPRPAAEGDEDFDDLTPRFVARYELSDDLSIYGTVSKGYKAGGSSVGNNTNQPGSPAFAVKFDEETLWNYELGFKSELLDNRVRLNGSVFYLEWSDLQMEAFRFLTPGDLSSNFEQTINIEDAEATGIELELQALVTDGLTLSGAIGYLDTEITSDTEAQITGGFVVDLEGLELPKAPELSANLAGEYRVPLTIAGCDCEGWVRLEYVHRDGQYSDIEGLTNKQTRGPSPNAGLVREMPYGEFPYLSPDFDVWNLRAGLDLASWSLAVYAQNLGDEEYYTGTQENFGVSGIRLRPHPQIFGGSIAYRF